VAAAGPDGLGRPEPGVHAHGQLTAGASPADPPGQLLDEAGGASGGVGPPGPLAGVQHLAGPSTGGQQRVVDQLRARFVEQAPQGWLPMLEATKALGVSRQTVLQRVKRGELRAVHVRTGRRKGLRIEIPNTDGGLLDALASTKGAV
jgi:excisionase family DNA binding protein